MFGGYAFLFVCLLALAKLAARQEDAAQRPRAREREAAAAAQADCFAGCQAG
jgi:hypothetical protein